MTGTALEMQMFIARGMSLIIAMRTEGIRCFHRRIIGLAKTDLERLVNGEIVEKDIREDLTYNELYASMDNLWSTLFMAGYLTHKGRVDTKRFRLAVPNREIRNIITEQVLALFKQNVEKDGQRP